MIEVELRYLIGDDWWPAGDLTARDLLDAWLAADRLTCCTIQGGFAITIDGRAWNHDCLDELRMTSTWLDAVLALLRGAAEARVWAWEESSLRIVRRGERVTMFDVHHSGKVVSPRVTVELVALARALLAPSLLAADHCDAVLDAAATRASPDQLATLKENLSLPWRQRVAELETALAAPLPASPEPTLSHMEEALVLDDAATFEPAHVTPELRQRALAVAVDLGRDWAIGPLLAAGARVDALTSDGRTLLCAAVARRRLSIAARLLANGADANARGDGPLTPLQQAAYNLLYWGDDALTVLLCEHGAKPDLMCAVLRGEIAIVIARASEAPSFVGILSKWVQRASREAYEQRPLAPWEPAIRALLAAGARWEDAPTGGRPALLEAVISGRPSVVRAVLSYDPPTDTRDQDGRNAREIAAASGNAELLALFDA